ncbi:MAG: SUMF1/EgtB/PvdO family nonheme iron enzyme, partial [Verrucomicrobiia bacterium]
TPDNAAEARNQMIATLGKIKSSDAPYLREMVQRGRGLEKAGGEAMQAKDYTKALSSFTKALKCYQQAVGIQTDMEAKRETAISLKKEAEKAHEAANAAFKTEARPESFVAAGKSEKDGEEALAREDYAKAMELFTRAIGGFKAAQAEADKLLRAERSRAAQSAKKDAEAARTAASAASKPEARPESFAAAGKIEKEGEEALAKEDFDKAKELFARAVESYKIAQADGEKLNRDEMSRAAYAKKRDAEAERLTAQAAFKNDTRPESFVTAGTCFKEGEDALNKEEFARAKDLFTRAFDAYKTAQADAEKISRAETSRAAWAKLLAEADAALLERQVAAEFAKVKSLAESAASLATKDPGQAAEQFVAATATLKSLIAKAKTTENLPKSVPVVARLENAIRANGWLQAHWALGELELLIPDDPRMADFRAKAAALPWPNGLAVDLGGGVTINFVFIRPGSFSMGEGNEKHQVALTKPYFIGKFEVTQQQWRTVMGSNPSANQEDARNPVENISWDACQGFVAKLNEKLSGVKVSLPTEAQWEYACRAGSSTKYCYGDDISLLDLYAVYPGKRIIQDNWRRTMTRSVGTKKPNAWGLYDMHGNVAEFCNDRFGSYPTSAQTDPQGAATGSDRVLRGGSSRDTPFYLTSSCRRDTMPVNVLANAGLRLVLVTDAMAGYQASMAKLPDTSSTPVASTPPSPPVPSASSTTPSTPSMTTAAPVAADDWMKGIPPRALPAYLQAQSDVKAGKGMLPMRSWRAFWGNKLRDPTRGYVELEFVELLLTDPSKEANAAAEEQKKQQNLKEAAIIVRSIRARGVTDEALLNRLEETAKKLP